MYQIYIGETLVTCETAEEAVALAAHLTKRPPSQTQRPLPTTPPFQPTQSRSFILSMADPSERSDVDGFISKIREFKSTSISSETMAHILNVESPQGVGPRLAAISKRFERVYGQPLDTVLEKDARPGQPTIWKVNSGTIEKTSS